MKNTFSLLALIGFVFLSACSGKKGKANQDVVHVKGNPYVFVQNSKMNFNEAFPSDLFVDGSSWYLMIRGYLEEPQINGSQMVKEQTPDPTRTQPEVEEVKPHKLTKNGIEWTLAVPSDDKVLSLRFTGGAGGVRLQGLYSEGHEYIAEAGIKVLHTSVALDRQSFSVLIHDPDPKSRAVIAYYFYRDTGANVDPSSSDPYIYVFGTGYKVGWDPKRAVVLKTCGSNLAPTQKDSVKTSVGLWASALGTGLSFSSSEQEVCPPFSDIQTQTYNYIDGWVTLIPGTGVNMGHTQIAPNFSTSQIMDADIMILMGEMQKFAYRDIHKEETLSNSRVASVFYETALHEMGHFLGLGHQFDDKVPSIMSYSENAHGKLTDYDTRAIRALYPERNLVQRILGF